MKKVLKFSLVLIMVLSMIFSSMILAAAEGGDDDPPEIDGTGTIIIKDPDASVQAYELVWCFRYNNGVYQKRRWNLTLGCWYDPRWVNV